MIPARFSPIDQVNFGLTIPTLPLCTVSIPWPLFLTKEQTHLRSAVRFYLLQHLEDAARRLFPGGRIENGIYCSHGVFTALDRTCVSGVELEPGAWLSSSPALRGEDLVTLYAQTHGGVSYGEALEALADAFGIGVSGAQVHKHPDWQQERHPLCPPGISPLPAEIQGGKNSPYFNRAGNHIGIASRQPCLDGWVDTYWTLWRRPNGSCCHWAPIFPQRPLMLFNAQDIHLRRNASVYFAHDELQAQALARSHCDIVFTAVPGGMCNFLDADLSELSGRSVCLCLDQEGLRYGHRYHKKMQDAGISDASFLPIGATACTLGDTLPHALLPRKAYRDDFI